MVENRPIKKYRSGSIEGLIWLNKRKKNGDEIEFKTVTIKRSWHDKESNVWRDERINIRKMDVPKLSVILSKLQEDLFLTKEVE